MMPAIRLFSCSFSVDGDGFTLCFYGKASPRTQLFGFECSIADFASWSFAIMNALGMALVVAWAWLMSN
jgi:hypothetical protein